MKATATSLELGTKYYARAFAATAFGTAYSDEIAVTTSDIAPADIAAITVGGSTYTSLTLSTEITNPHGTVTSYGFCWSVSNALPTTDDHSRASVPQRMTQYPGLVTGRRTAGSPSLRPATAPTCSKNGAWRSHSPHRTPKCRFRRG